MENGSVTPKKCCVKYDPPTLILYYETSIKNVRKRSIPIKDLPLKEGDLILKGLFEGHHKPYLEKFNRDQIIRVMNVLIEKNDGIKISEQKTSNNNSSLTGIDFENDNLNQLDDNKLNEVKTLMNGSFEQNQVKPGDQNWQYNIEVDFDKGANNGETGVIESAEWDDESDMEF